MRLKLRGKTKLPEGVEDITDEYDGTKYDDDRKHIAVFETKHTIILIDQDDVTDPRDCDGYLGTMICWHPRYDLGDSHKLLPDWIKTGYDFAEWMRENCKEMVYLPLYIYDHSGITMHYIDEWPYNDVWDSSFVGYIYATFERIRDNFSCKRLTKKRLEQAKDILKSEVEEYDAYLTGDTYAFEQICKECGSFIDGVSGFYGTEWMQNGLFECCDYNAGCNSCNDIKARQWNLVANLCAGE